jgi:hypothetical protein
LVWSVTGSGNSALELADAKEAKSATAGKTKKQALFNMAIYKVDYAAIVKDAKYSAG